MAPGKPARQDGIAAPSAPASPAPSLTVPDFQSHRKRCTICHHPERRRIEEDFVDWVAPAEIVRRYKLGRSDVVSRHARATTLFHKRRQNVHRVLDRLIEHVNRVEPNAATIVSAVRLAVDINSHGEWVEPGDRVYLQDLFGRMTAEELDAYAGTGALPDWFQKALGTIPPRSCLPPLPNPARRFLKRPKVDAKRPPAPAEPPDGDTRS